MTSGSAPSAERRRDLAAMISPVWRWLLEAEQSITAANGVSMWGYAVLYELGDGPVRTQVALATALGIDKTRLIPYLDELQQRRLITRKPDPEDRRAHLLSLTTAGERLRARVQRQIHTVEDQLLSSITDTERGAFVSALDTLSTAVIDRIQESG